MEQHYLVAIQHIPKIGAVSSKKLVERFGSAQKAWLASENELTGVLSKSQTQACIQTRKTIDPKVLYNSIIADSIGIVTLADDTYPELLRNIYDPPPVLYILGKLPDTNSMIAVVGTRKNTSYGKQITQQLVTEMVAEGMVIVSGLARGIDSIAHQAAIDAGGQTIAVLGSGLKHIYPREHTKLASNIVASSGAVISEFPPDFPAVPGNFPARNRIISGLSLGIVVTEAAEKSGTMITVDTALDQGRDVFSVPGPITSKLSVGTMKLIREGATLVTSGADIVEQLNLETANVFKKPEIAHQYDSAEEAVVLEVLSDEEHHIDDIVRTSNLSLQQVCATLTLLEIKGYVSLRDDNTWIKT